MKSLTDKQQRVLKFLESSLQDLGYWPSIREIQEHFGFRSTNAVVGHLRALERKGIIQRRSGHARAYQIPQATRQPKPVGALEVTTIPVLGAIAAGYPDLVEAGGEIEQLQVDSRTARSRQQGAPVFAIRVHGESMINAGINHGDTVVVEAREPRDGEIVAALIDGLTTLKRYIAKPGSTPYLKAENPEYPELFPAEELQIQGVARAVVKPL